MVHDVVRMFDSIALLVLALWWFKMNRRIKAIEDDLHRNSHCRR